VLLTVLHSRTSGQSLQHDSANVGAWALNLSLGALTLVVTTPVYHWIFYQRLWPELPDSYFIYGVAVLCYDFLYYWFHRASHRFWVLWNVHSVHHQATRLVPSLGMRSSAFDFAVLWLILGLMFWVGFSSQMIIFTLAVHGFYQIFLHNEWKINLGSLEWILNTPNHHRLHHAINPEYLDKNFGSILIIWDRIFGTFAEKSTEPEIGIVGANHWSSPLRSNLIPWVSGVFNNRSSQERVSAIKSLFQFMAILTLLSSLLYFHWRAEWVFVVVFLCLFVAELLPGAIRRAATGQKSKSAADSTSK